MLANGMHWKQFNSFTMRICKMIYTGSNNALENYVYGNITAAREWFEKSPIRLGDFVECYIHKYAPSAYQITLFINRMENK
jgi:hypothetical protein